MLAIIGGSGLYGLQDFGDARIENVCSDYGDREVAVELYATPAGEVAFLPRHGKAHNTPPHRVNYRANIDALHRLGVSEILAINAVGGITASTGPGSFIVPDQIIDYTHGRSSSFFEDQLDKVVHVDFSSPFSTALTDRLLALVQEVNQNISDPRMIQAGGIYGCTQGPRLETAAEIKRMARDGCDIVGMTAMPEAVLAREKQIDYAMLALSVNWAAGIVPGVISMADIEAVMLDGMEFVRRVLNTLLAKNL